VLGSLPSEFGVVPAGSRVTASRRKKGGQPRKSFNRAIGLLVDGPNARVRKKKALAKWGEKGSVAAYHLERRNLLANPGTTGVVGNSKGRLTGEILGSAARRNGFGGTNLREAKAPERPNRLTTRLVHITLYTAPTTQFAGTKRSWLWGSPSFRGALNRESSGSVKM